MQELPRNKEREPAMSNEPKGIEYERLQELTGGKSPAKVAEILVKQGIKPLYGIKNRPFLLPDEYLPKDSSPASKNTPKFEV